MEVKYTISPLTAGFMYGVAAIFEGLQLLLDITGFLALGAPLLILPFWGIIGIILLAVHYDFGSDLKHLLLILLASTAFEAIPLLDAGPGLTVGLNRLIQRSRKEDRERFAKEAAQKARMEQSRVQRIRAMQAARANTANDNSIQAANDNEGEESREAA